MSEERWQAIDDYIVDRLLPRDPVLDAVLAANEAAGLPAVDVTPAQGKLLYLLARMSGARRILEVGTLGGYSTIWLARALPSDGVVVTLESEIRHAEVARANIAAAGLSERVDLRIGRALDLLPDLKADGGGPFDFVFIDADKKSNADYLAWALELSRPGTAIVGDNVIRGGSVAHPASTDRGVQGTRRFFDMLSSEPRLSATAIQTVGAKGWDGFALALVE